MNFKSIKNSKIKSQFLLVMMYTLSKIDIAGGIDKNTPNIVLKEISEYPKKVVIHIPLIHKEYRKVGSFFNRDATWSIDELHEAVDFVIEFQLNPRRIELPFLFGIPLPTKPQTYTACMLYRLLKERNLYIHKNATMDQLADAVSVAYDSSTKTRLSLKRIISGMNPDQLSRLYSQALNIVTEDIFDYDIEKDEDSKEFEREIKRKLDEIENDCELDEYLFKGAPLPTVKINKDDFDEINRLTSNIIEDYDDIEDTVKFMKDNVYLRKRIDPQTKIEAIILASLNYEIDLSFCSNPILEYNHLVTTTVNYSPTDPLLIKCVEVNPYIMRLDMYFNPHLPQEIYSQDTLTKLALAEGYSMEELRNESCYSLLQSSSISETFYPGKHIKITNKYTLQDYDNISNIPSSLIVCFGVIGETLIAFRYRELTAYFKETKAFLNPYNNQLFSQFSITKLRKICESINPSEDTSHLVEKIELLKIIDDVILINQGVDFSIKEFINKYEECDLDTRRKIELAILLLHDLGMCMRGWDCESDEFPVKLAPVYDEEMVENNVYLVMTKFMDTLKSLEEMGTMILKLPLLKYIDGIFILSTERGEGATIGERIDLVCKGSTTYNMSSCIRLSSNWICCTSYKLLSLLDINMSYDIADLRHIS
jgi:hypothetical protein